MHRAIGPWGDTEGQTSNETEVPKVQTQGLPTTYGVLHAIDKQRHGNTFTYLMSIRRKNR